MPLDFRIEYEIGIRSLERLHGTTKFKKFFVQVLMHESGHLALIDDENSGRTSGVSLDDVGDFARSNSAAYGSIALKMGKKCKTL